MKLLTQTAFAFAISMLTIFSSAARAANTPLFGNVGLDPSFCKQKTIRQTVVYIDDQIMVDGQIDWAKKINTKLKSTLVPGEHVTVVRLSPMSGQSTEIWTGCWPAYSKEQQASMEKENYFFSQNPLEELTQQQAFFVRDFGAALTVVYEAGKRSAEEVKITSKTAPRKQILRALASDEGRFSGSSVPIRAIIYSDMLENSDLGSVFLPMPAPFPNFAEKLGSKFRKGIFYAFGVAEDMDEGQGGAQSLKPFWTNVFKNMSAVMNGFGSDLNVSNSVPVAGYSYNLHYAFDNQDLDGKMSILVDGDGNIVDSWIGFSRLSIAGISGTFLCTNDNCKLDGTTTTSIATNSPTETLVMTGKTAKLNGQLGVSGTKMIFDLKGELATN